MLQLFFLVIFELASLLLFYIYIYIFATKLHTLDIVKSILNDKRTYI